MAGFNSLHAYLDHQLPSRLTINLRNFFSFLPFVSPVDERMATLRNLVNKADNNYQYLNYYQTNYTYFNQLFPENSFAYSSMEKTLVQATRAESLKPSDSPRTMMTSFSSKVTKIEKSPNYLSQITVFADNEDWQNQLNTLLTNLSPEAQKQLARTLMKESLETRKENIKRCAIYVIDTIASDLDGIRKNVFDDLQHDHDIEEFEYYLTLKGYIHEQQLFSLIDDLSILKASNETQVYGVQLDFHQLKHKLKPLYEGKPQAHANDFATFADKFKEWKLTHQTGDSNILDTLEKIALCIQKLTAIMTAFGSEQLKEKYTRDEVAEKNRNASQREKEEFLSQLRRGEIPTVGIQRLREFFPDEKRLTAMIKQCARLGVVVIDGTDPFAVREALQEKEALKYM